MYRHGNLFWVFIFCDFLWFFDFWSVQGKGPKQGSRAPECLSDPCQEASGYHRSPGPPPPRSLPCQSYHNSFGNFSGKFRCIHCRSLLCSSFSDQQHILQANSSLKVHRVTARLILQEKALHESFDTACRLSYLVLADVLFTRPQYPKGRGARKRRRYGKGELQDPSFAALRLERRGAISPPFELQAVADDEGMWAHGDTPSMIDNRLGNARCRWSRSKTLSGWALKPPERNSKFASGAPTPNSVKKTQTINKNKNTILQIFEYFWCYSQGIWVCGPGVWPGVSLKRQRSNKDRGWLNNTKAHEGRQFRQESTLGSNL